MIRNVNDLRKYFIEASRKTDVYTIAVDGPGGAGKSVFAEKIRQALFRCNVVHLDDFYIPASDPSVIGSNFDWQRLIQQVLEPSKTKDTITFRVFNWITNELGDWKTIHTQKFLIIEGVTSGRYELRQFIDFIIYIDTPYENRLSRGIDRDGVNILEKWMNDWAPREQLYEESLVHQPKESANVVVDGTYESAVDVNAIQTLQERGEYFG